MRESEQSVARAVSSLLAKRTTIQGFLAKLAPLEDSATPAVYRKVQADYEARLTELEAHLAERRDDLARAIGPRREAVEELERERVADELVLEEAAVRYRVGEYAKPEWDSRRSAKQAALQELEGVLSREREALATLEALRAELVVGGRVGNEADAEEEIVAASEFRLVKSWSAGNRSGLVARAGPAPDARQT